MHMENNNFVGAWAGFLYENGQALWYGTGQLVTTIAATTWYPGYPDKNSGAIYGCVCGNSGVTKLFSKCMYFMHIIKCLHYLYS